MLVVGLTFSGQYFRSSIRSLEVLVTLVWALPLESSANYGKAGTLVILWARRWFHQLGGRECLCLMIILLGAFFFIVVTPVVDAASNLG